MKNRFLGALQTTLRKSVVLSGTGVHSGAPVSIKLLPAEANTGIQFNIMKGEQVVSIIPADCDTVKNVTLCTVLGDGEGNIVATVEHLLSALQGMCVDNLIVEINSGEVPIMDGSSEPFVEAIEKAGVLQLKSARRYLKVLKAVRVEEGDAFAEIRPHNGFNIDVEIDFESDLIGRQRLSMDVNPGSYRNELCRARTFGFMSDVEKLWAAGRALGASMENTIALGDDAVMNPEGLRYNDEFVRHKAMDAVGDLALIGMPLLGAYQSYKGGHRLNFLAAQALLSDRDAWAIVEAPVDGTFGNLEADNFVSVPTFEAKVEALAE